jgi:dihydropyrimidine dehydrogenase (NADP+)
VRARITPPRARTVWTLAQPRDTGAAPLLVRGTPADGPDLAVTLPSGLRLPNPFLIASGPPGTNYAVMAKAFTCGWGGVVAKTVSLDASAVVNVTPR